MAFNPILMLARRSLPGRFGIEIASSPDEAPIDSEKLKCFGQSFDVVELCAPECVFFRMGGYLKPFSGGWPAKGLAWADDLLTRCTSEPHWLSYYSLITLRRRAG
jgi:hypothetical protein